MSRGALRVTLDHEGRTRVHDRYAVTAPVAGIVRRIELEPGDPVVGGETVVATFAASTSIPLDSRSRAEARANAAAAAPSSSEQKPLPRRRRPRPPGRATRRRARRSWRGRIVGASQREATETAARAAAGIWPRRARRSTRRSINSRLRALVCSSQRTRPAGNSPRPQGADRRRRSPAPAREPVTGRGRRAPPRSGRPRRSRDGLRLPFERCGGDPPGDAGRIDQWGGGTTLHGVVRLVEPSGFTRSRPWGSKNRE